MQTCTNSQPLPREAALPVRLPVMRWPIRSKRPSFLMSMWISSPGFGALVTAHRLGRLQRLQAVQTEPPKDTADGGRRDAQFGSDLPADQPPAAQRLDLALDRVNRSPRHVVRSR
jgi:hypothetical protein